MRILPKIDFEIHEKFIRLKNKNNILINKTIKLTDYIPIIKSTKYSSQQVSTQIIL